VTDETPSAHAEVVQRFWLRAEPFIAEALEHANGSHTVEDVLEGIAKGDLQLWVGESCAAVSEILRFPRKRALNMFLAGGDAEDLKRLAPGVEAFARARGCSMVMSTARLSGGAKRGLRRLVGWLSFWPDYEPGHILCTKDLA
jgi:hypothetical protein